MVEIVRYKTVETVKYLESLKVIYFPDSIMAENKDLKRTTGDTQRIIFKLVDEEQEPIDITDWTSFLFTVHSRNAPVSDATEIFQLAGTIEDGINGKVYFPDNVSNEMRDASAGRYYYDVQATNEDSEVVTFVEGRLILQGSRKK